MRAITHDRYGGPDVLTLSELPTPEPGPGQALVRVVAASINAADYRLMRADPFLARAENGWLGPRKWPVLGSDFAGVVARVGEGVTRVRPGDAVFGDAFEDGRGAFADFVCVRATTLAHKPAGVPFADAAATPLAALTALQGLRDLGRVQPGDDVLIQGAGGGVGAFAVQLAHAMGARVTAVCSERGAALARAGGADVVLDYAAEDFTARPERHDVIVGVNGYHPLSDYRRCLKPGGRYVMIGGTTRQLFEALLLGRWAFAFGDRSCHVLTIDASTRAEDTRELARLLEAGAITPPIDRTFPLEDARRAFEYVERGSVRGKVVLEVSEAP
jgi:NADPH:quinone reductase-like Zn-dependent oxidoreductase